MHQLKLLVISFCIFFITPQTRANNKENIQQPVEPLVFVSPIKVYNNLILIRGNIGAVDGYFVWDNGFSFSAIDSQLDIYKEKIQDAPIIGIDPLGHDIHLELYSINSLTFGDIELEHPQVIDIDVDHLFSCSEYKILGFIGANIINIFSWSFDFDHQTVTVSPSDFEVKENDKSIHVDYLIDETTFLHYMPITINGVDGLSFIDWGQTSQNLSVSDKYLSFFSSLQKRYTVEGGSMKTVTGDNLLSEYVVLDNQYRLKFGDISIEGSFRPTVGLMNQNSDVSIGNYIFRAHHNVIINTANPQYILTPRKNKKENGTPEYINYGITLTKLSDRTLEIEGIIKEHPSVVSSGIKPQMEVLSVNGLKPSHFSSQCELDDYMQSLKKEGKEVNIQLVGGKDIKLKLVDMWVFL